MEWIIGLIILYLIWRIFFASAAEEDLIKKEISNAYYNLGEQYHVDIFYSHCEDFAKKRNAYGDADSISFEMLIDRVNHTITFFKHERVGFAKNPYTNILVKKT